MSKNITSYVLFGILLLVISSISSCCQKSTEKLYYENGSIKEVSEKTCEKFEGISKSYYKNGQLSSIGKFKNDNFDGEWVSYYSSGEIKSKQVYSNGSLVSINVWSVNGEHQVINGNGKAIILYPNGNKASVQTYLNNKINGESRTWYENGNLESITNYSHDEPCGTWLFYDSTGVLESTMEKKMTCN